MTSIEDFNDKNVRKILSDLFKKSKKKHTLGLRPWVCLS